ncbi:cysteine-rich receptor-like protein kinase 44 [Euphorbia lathyris]|uniref:cysteine-rich receptor-like protein kinase 44 n=1 Tax=Euphorbia lathyris TaxID=212925 RepID=UPI00331423C6
MNFTKFLFSSCLLLQFALLTVAQPAFLHQWCFNDRGNYTSNSIYKTNLDTLLSSLDSNLDSSTSNGFYNLSIGQGVGQVNAKALCRGDVGVEDCKSCIRNSTSKVLEICPNQKDAIGVYDFCNIRYSNRTIFGVEETSPTFLIMGQINASDVNKFTQAQQTLLNRLRGLTASGDSTLKFAVGDEGAGFEKVYGLTQCSPDLSGQECDDCIGEAIGDIAGCCSGKLVGSVIKPSCQVWFDNKLFYQLTPSVIPPPPVTSLSPPPPPTKGKKSNTAKTVVIIVVPTVCVVILAIFIYLFLRGRKAKPKENADNDVDDIETGESLQLEFDIISVATNNFSDQNKLGQGGFGAVYKGTLANGQEIAVKRLSKNSGQGDLEFKNEVILVAKLQHRNLVRLLGFCLKGSERLLIYEFVANTSLDHFIFDPIKCKNLDWDKRYKIICGIARGLLYLHEDSRLRIIHRDMKASNILLDEEMNPKIADFGMARLFVMDQTQGNTSRIVGTYGYMAPEYAMHGHFSVKTDVFSFGVLLLEILSGQRNSSFRNGDNIEDLLSFAWRSWREGTTMNLIDPNLKDGSSGEMMRCFHIGLLCVQDNVANRPTMASVVLMLNSFSLTLPVPSQPAFFMHTITESDMSSSSRVTESTRSRDELLPILSNNEASITDLDPR